MPVVFTHLHSFSLFFSWEPLVHLCKSAAQGLLFLFSPPLPSLLLKSPVQISRQGTAFIFPTATKLTFEVTCANQLPRDCFLFSPPLPSLLLKSPVQISRPGTAFYFPHRYQAYF